MSRLPLTLVLLFATIEDDVDASGPIGIQHHGEKGATYCFRNLRIKELKYRAINWCGRLKSQVVISS